MDFKFINVFINPNGINVKKCQSSGLFGTFECAMLRDGLEQ
jgi:hypothetical protein